jgi:ribulose-5-phosphate 4-epimerase/fuculose-1-phosphate aldolase
MGMSRRAGEFKSSRREFCRAGSVYGLAAAAARFASLRAMVTGLAPATSSAGAPAQAGAGGSADSDDQRIADLIAGNHILFDQGVVDGFGHITVRSAQNPSHYWMASAVAPALVTKDDIIEFDENSKALDARGRPVHGERFIHGEIYRVRPDAISIVHSHSSAVIPFAVTKEPLRPVIHTAGFLPIVTPVFEIRDVAGDDNHILVNTREFGTGLAKALGNAPVILMRGHGDAVVGASVKKAVYRAIYTQLNAQIQAVSLQVGQGDVVYLNPMESANVDAINEGGGVERSWQIWVARADADLAALNSGPTKQGSSKPRSR